MKVCFWWDEWENYAFIWTSLWNNWICPNIIIISTGQVILLCLCSNQLWQNDGGYHQPAAFKHLKYTLSDLQPIRIQSDTYSWSIFVLSTNQLYMQMPKVVLALSIPLNDGGDTGILVSLSDRRESKLLQTVW